MTTSELYNYENTDYQPDISSLNYGTQPSPATIEQQIYQYPLNQRVVLVGEDQKKATYKIDNCIQAIVPSNQFREIARQHWEEKKYACQKRAWRVLAIETLGICAVVLSASVGMATIATGVGVIVSLFGIYGGVQLCKLSQSTTQIKEWEKAPIELLAQQRKRAYEQGFPYAYQNQLKLNGNSHHQVLLPNEIQYLLEKYLDQTCPSLLSQECIDDKQKTRWINQLRDLPLSNDVLKYVYNGAIPKKYIAISQRFETLMSSLTNVSEEFKKIKKERKAEYQQNLTFIELQRELARCIPDQTLQHMLSKAQDARDEELRENSQDHQKCSYIHQQYSLQNAQYRAVHATAILAISVYFDGKRREAKEDFDRISNAIAEQEAHTFSPYYEYGKTIVTALTKAKDPAFVDTETPVRLAPILQIPNLPKIEIHFTLPSAQQVTVSYT